MLHWHACMCVCGGVVFVCVCVLGVSVCVLGSYERVKGGPKQKKALQTRRNLALLSLVCAHMR